MSDQLSIDDFGEVQEALWKARSKWYNIGVRLKMDTTDLDVIDIDGGTKVESKFNLMLQSWLKTKEPRTWKVLYEALRHPTVDMSVLAETLRINYIVKKQLDALYAPDIQRVKTGETKSMEREGKCDEPQGEQLSQPGADSGAGPKYDSHTPASDTLQVKAGETKRIEREEKCDEPQGEQLSQPGAVSDEKESEAMIRIRKSQLESKFTDLVVAAQKDMTKNNVDIERLCHSILLLPHDLKDEHKRVIKEIKAELKCAKSVKDVFYAMDDYWDFLNYSLLQHIIKECASEEMKKEMYEFAQEVITFRKVTRLHIFSKLFKRKPKKANEKFRKLVTEHDIDLKTATLERVEEIRQDICSELSLPDFSLEIAAVESGSLVITWLVPQSLVAYIQGAIKLSSPSMRNHHVSKLTIDGFIAYDSAIAMQSESKMSRLEQQAVHINHSYLLDEMVPDELVPHLVARRLLTPEEAKAVTRKSDRLQRITTILQALNIEVGMLTTFSAALRDAGQSLIAEELTKHFQDIMGGLSPSIPPTEDDVMISGEVSAQPSPPPPDSCLITAQVEGSTLTRAQYTKIASLMSSLLCLPTGVLEYVGHTLHPLTLHWHCSAAERGESDPQYSIGILSAMAQEGIVHINVGKKLDSVIPRWNEMKLFECAWDGDMEGVKYALDSAVQVNVQRPDRMTALMCASQEGHVEVANTLLHRGASAEMQDNDGETALMYASQNGHEEVVNTLLQQHGASVEMPDNDGWTALMYASQNGHVEVVKTLLQHGANVEMQDNDDQTALMYASQDGHVEVVNTLLHHEASIEMQDNDGETALMYASRKGHVEVVNTLLQRGAVADSHKKNGRTALMYASQDGHVEVVNTLLQHDARAEMQDNDGWTALMYASQDGHVEVVNTLLQHGASAEMQDNDGWTALMYASQDGHVEVVNTLLQHGASVEMQDNVKLSGSLDGRTALMSASLDGHVEVVNTLLQHGASVEIEENDGSTALMYASQNGHVEVVKTLLQHGAIVDFQNENGVTALMVAIHHGSSGVTEVLLGVKADVNIITKDGNTALTLACQREDLTTVHALITLRAEPNVCTKEGQTPLLLAVRKSNITMATKLLEAGADPNHMQEGGLSALMMCGEEGNSEMTELLLSSQTDPDLQQSDTGFTALMFACKGGHGDTVSALLEHNANPAIKNKEGMTAATVAATNQHTEVMDILELKAPQTNLPIEDFEHPDNRIMEEAKEVTSRFFGQMDHVPIIALYNRHKDTSLQVPREKNLQST